MADTKIDRADLEIPDGAFLPLEVTPATIIANLHRRQGRPDQVFGGATSARFHEVLEKDNK